MRKEALHLACTTDRNLVLLGKLVHAEDRDDVLEILVSLEDLLHATGYFVVLLTDDLRIEDSRGRCKGIDGRVDALLGDTALQDDEGVQVSERGRGCRVGEVVRRNVDRLHRSDGTLARRGDSLLHRTHLGREVRLVPHGAGHAAQECGYFGAGLGESEDVVDEDQRFLAGRIAEVLGHRQT